MNSDTSFLDNYRFFLPKFQVTISFVIVLFIPCCQIKFVFLSLTLLFTKKNIAFVLSKIQ